MTTWTKTLRMWVTSYFLTSCVDYMSNKQLCSNRLGDCQHPGKTQSFWNPALLHLFVCPPSAFWLCPWRVPKKKGLERDIFMKDKLGRFLIGNSCFLVFQLLLPGVWCQLCRLWDGWRFPPVCLRGHLTSHLWHVGLLDARGGSRSVRNRHVWIVAFSPFLFLMRPLLSDESFDQSRLLFHRWNEIQERRGSQSVDYSSLIPKNLQLTRVLRPDTLFSVNDYWQVRNAAVLLSSTSVSRFHAAAVHTHTHTHIHLDEEMSRGGHHF